MTFNKTQSINKKPLTSYLLILSLACLCFSCKKELKKQQGNLIFLDFINEVKDTEESNILNYLYFYNGAGVGVADLVGDSLPDIYLVSNRGENQLLENKGNMQFENVTQKAGVSGTASWQTGVAIADVNHDGLNDIFVCAVSGIHGFTGHNELYINQGDGSFQEQSEEFGLNAQDYSTAASFFDYDLDGDLDMYLLNHAVHTEDGYRKPASQVRFERTAQVGDRLYQNQNGHFVDVSQQAGIFGGKVNYGLAVKVSDLNRDGYPDIYVSNDFHENDYIYMNNGDGSFTQDEEKLLHYSTRFSMGNDIADINNDLWPDIFVADMQPYDPIIEKNTPAEDSPEIYEFKLKHGYHPQYGRNTLQLNYNGQFQEVAQLYGLNATDWSWSPIIADFNNDGKQDLFVSNGIWRRPNDLDYLKYISTDEVAKQLASGSENDLNIVEKMPQGLVHNFLFFQDSLGFTDVSRQMGFSLEDASNGVAAADLDGDGDLDLVINRLNDHALIWNNPNQGNFIQLALVDSVGSPVLGASASLFSKNNQAFRELLPQRGFMSSSEPKIHFGLPSSEAVRIEINWPNAAITVDTLLANKNYTFIQPKAGENRKANLAWNEKEDIKTDANSSQFDGNPLKPYTNYGSENQLISTSGNLTVEALPWSKPKVTISGQEIEHIAPSGFWLSATLFDKDGDGDLDILMGNLGMNNRLRASEQEPLKLFEFDYDNNQQQDIILAQSNGGKYYPVLWKDQLAATIPQIKKQYTDYHGFANQEIKQIFGKAIEKAKVKEMTSLSSGWLIQDQGKFIWEDLPLMLQAGPINQVEKQIDTNTKQSSLVVSGYNNDWIPTIGQQYLLKYRYDENNWTIYQQ